MVFLSIKTRFPSMFLFFISAAASFLGYVKTLHIICKEVGITCGSLILPCNIYRCQALLAWHTNWPYYLSFVQKNLTLNSSLPGALFCVYKVTPGDMASWTHRHLYIKYM
jgi:hypothetical protein